MDKDGHEIEMTNDPIFGLEILNIKCPNKINRWFAVMCGSNPTICNVWKTDPCSDCPILEHYSEFKENEEKHRGMEETTNA
jgi:hypothetical protein